MKIGGNTLYPDGLLPREASFGLEAVEGALRKLKDAGYEAVEYSHAFDLTHPEAQDAGRYARLLGLESHSVHGEGTVGFRLGNAAEEARAALMHCLDVGAALGARVLVVHAPCTVGLHLPEDTPLDQTMDADLRVLEPVCTRAHSLGIRLALENGRDLAHMEYVVQLCGALPAATAGICVDTGHANLGDLGVLRAIRMAGEKLITTHLQDNHGQADDHLPPGEGQIDWVQVFAALRHAGYAGPLMLELTDAAWHRPYDQDLELKQGLQNTWRLWKASA